MKIFLLRHAIAEKRNISKFPNDDRPLSSKGRQQIKELAPVISSICGKIDKLYCSPLRRSLETAQAVKLSNGYSKKIFIIKELLPDESPQKLIKLISKLKNDSTILLVGHEPFLSNFLCKTTGIKLSSVEFKKAGLSLIMLGTNKVPVLKFMIQPKMLIRLNAK